MAPMAAMMAQATAYQIATKAAVILAGERVARAPTDAEHSNDCSREEGLRRRGFPHEDEGQDHGWQRKKKNVAHADGKAVLVLPMIGEPVDRI
jgi:hypothetical protein